MIEATPVPVTPPPVPPRPPLWVVIEPPTHFSKSKLRWDWKNYPDVYDNEFDANEAALECPGSVIFRLPGSGEVSK